MFGVDVVWCLVFVWLPLTAGATALCLLGSSHRLVAGDVRGVLHVFDLQKYGVITRVEIAKK